MSAFHPFFAIHAGCFARQNGQAAFVALRIKPDRQLPIPLPTSDVKRIDMGIDHHGDTM